MNNQQILEKAIQKAIDGGWNQRTEGATTWMLNEVSPGQIFHIGFDFIFNHDFAKALWGDSDFDRTATNLWEGDGYTSARFVGNAWQYHLQQMVIAEDPIKYLGENI